MVGWFIIFGLCSALTCLVTEGCQTADPGVASSIPARSQTNQNHLFLPNLIIAALASI